MGQIQSSVNQVASNVIGGVIGKQFAPKYNAFQSPNPARDEEVGMSVINTIVGDIKAQEAWEKVVAEENAREESYNKQRVVASKYGSDATSKMSEAEIDDRYFKLTDPKGYAEEQQAMDDASNEDINEEISKYVAAGWDEDRAATFVIDGVDTMDNPEAAIPNYNYDSAKGKQANNVSLKQSITKKRLNKSFENRLANAKSRKIRQQSVGGKK